MTNRSNTQILKSSLIITLFILTVLPVLAKTHNNRIGCALHKYDKYGITLTDSVPDTRVFTAVEKQPSFPGGINAFSKFLSENLVYPKNLKTNRYEGRVFCQFIVEKDGSLTNIKIVRSLDPECDKEAIRILSISPKWIPGQLHGEIVRVSHTIPILFKPR